MDFLKKYLIRMVIFLLIITSILAYNNEYLEIFFLTNPTLNGLILTLLILGIFLMFRQVISLYPEIEWLNSYISTKKNNKLSKKNPELLKPVFQILKSQSERLILTQTGARSILESVESRLFENRETSRYFVGLLIFLGLLGTFWGLLETINSVSITIKSLDFSQDTDKLFLVLKNGLEKPLGGMGTAFSSSLFGLGGSLILGFLDLQSSQASNRFYNEIEEKLAVFTKLSLHQDNNVKNDFGPAYIESLVETTTENLKKSTIDIEQQNINQKLISKSLTEMSQFLSNNNILNKEIKDEIKTLSKTIASSYKNFNK